MDLVKEKKRVAIRRDIIKFLGFLIKLGYSIVFFGVALFYFKGLVGGLFVFIGLVTLIWSFYVRKALMRDEVKENA